MKDCFSSEVMFFGGGKYKYDWEKHFECTNKRISKFENDKRSKALKKVCQYKDIDGIEFIYNVDYPSDGCILNVNNKNIRISRDWCHEIKEI